VRQKAPAACPEKFVKDCLVASREECIASARVAIEHCIADTTEPPVVDVATAREWGRKIGKCTVARVARAMQRAGKFRSECNSPDDAGL
jgi:hypothetical protein